VLLPYGKVEFQYLADSNVQNVTAQVVGLSTPSTLLPRLSQDKNFGNFAAGVSAILPNGISCFFNYEQLFGQQDFRNEKYTLGLRIEF
jgi:outer membrane autotransporter protein